MPQERAPPDLRTAYKPNVDTNNGDKYQLNDPLNKSINTPGSNFACKDYGTPINLPKDSKDIQPGGISHKEVNWPEESHLTFFQKENYS